MSKIGADHLARRAYVYIRQSTLDQVHNNRESQRRQYALADRARELGWEDIEVIDDDLGRSGAGTKRPGFERMLGGLCGGRVGARRPRDVRARGAAPLAARAPADPLSTLGRDAGGHPDRLSDDRQAARRRG